MHTNRANASANRIAVATPGAGSINADDFNRCAYFLLSSRRNDATIQESEQRKYRDVVNAISLMANLPRDHGYFLDYEVSRRAIDMLGAIQYCTLAPAPRLLNESGEGVSFTWDFGAIKRYLTVHDEGADISDYAKSDSRPLREVSIDGAAGVDLLLGSPGFGRRSASANRV